MKSLVVTLSSDVPVREHKTGTLSARKQDNVGLSDKKRKVNDALFKALVLFQFEYYRWLAPLYKASETAWL